MKVLGIGENDTLICKVDKKELQKFFNCYYSNESSISALTLNNIKTGSTIDLGQGHDYLSDITSALHELKTFVRANERIIKGISNGLLLLAETKPD